MLLSDHFAIRESSISDRFSQRSSFIFKRFIFKDVQFSIHPISCVLFSHQQSCTEKNINSFKTFFFPVSNCCFLLCFYTILMTRVFFSTTNPFDCCSVICYDICEHIFWQFNNLDEGENKNYKHKERTNFVTRKEI